MSCKIAATLVSFRNLPAVTRIKNSVVIFWESHTKNPDDAAKTQSTIDLIPKKFDLSTCECYEVRTGYLSRYNYLSKPKEESSIEELEEAIIKGEEEQSEWTRRCSPKLDGFTLVNWQECVNARKNPHFTRCKELLLQNIDENDSFMKAYKESADAYAVKRNTNKKNGFSYLVEENSWILTLPLMYPNKQIYIIHIGNVTDSTTILFSTFEYLRESSRLLFPYFFHKTFESASDFKLEYEGKSNYGYFVEEADLLGIVAKEKKEQTREELVEMLLRERAEKELLSAVIAKTPGHVYWLNNKREYLGCNDAQAKHIGLNSRDEIVGKTVFDLLPPAEARKHDNINKLVINRGKTYSGEEKASMRNGFRTYLSQKSPLMNNSGKRVGLLGMSFDIMDRKNAEELRIQNKLKRKELEQRQQIKILAEQVAHDIRSPLIALNIIADNCADLSEKNYVALRNAIANIESVANKLLAEYEECEKPPVEKSAELYISPNLSLQEIINGKKPQYEKLNATLNYTHDPADNFVFIKGDYSDFCRMTTNLLNNSVEAVEKGKEGIIDVGFRVKDRKVEIYIKDNGAGMPREIVGKIMGDIPVESSKRGGHGIGMRQVKQTLDAMNGRMSIKSQKNVGTEITLIFPECDPPKWFPMSVVLSKGDVVVVLDDDSSICDVWKRRFEKFFDNITIKCFTDGKEAIDFINSFKKKDKIFLLADYELRGQKINGVDVIEKSGAQNRSIIVTSAYISKIKEFNEKSDFIKLLPKPYINEIPILMEDEKPESVEKLPNAR